MRPIRRVLVAVDFSRGARAAAEHALLLARTFRATVDLLHVYEPPSHVVPELRVFPPGADPLPAEVYARQLTERQMRDFVAALDVPAGVTMSTRVESGIPWRAIREAADDGGYDLVAMGTHGRRGLERMLLGSVAEKIVRHVRCPVLTVRRAE